MQNKQPRGNVEQDDKISLDAAAKSESGCLESNEVSEKQSLSTDWRQEWVKNKQRLKNVREGS